MQVFKIVKLVATEGAAKVCEHPLKELSVAKKLKLRSKRVQGFRTIKPDHFGQTSCLHVYKREACPTTEHVQRRTSLALCSTMLGTKNYQS
mmetsp:Transcript_65133/g.114910  ORF Transcript_65133/g.114910 Transcript_65133/m.114910 type:complete len:91 (+) Transcript_65133:103-375(+)